MIFFLHTPKTAGTTFYEVVKQNHFKLLKPKMEENPIQYLNYSITRNRIAVRLPGGYETASKVLIDISQLPDEKMQNISFIGGHVGYGFHEFFNGEVEYVCFIRNPRERIISDFKEHCKKGRYFYEILSKNDFCFNTYLTIVKEYNLDNFLTRQLAGPPEFFLNNRKTIDNNQFEKAKLNSKSVLFFEMRNFDIALHYMKNKFGWNKIKYQIKNQSNKIEFDFDVDEILFQEVIKYDLKLYNFIEPIQFNSKTIIQRLFGSKRD